MLDEPKLNNVAIVRKPNLINNNTEESVDLSLY